MKLTLNDKRQFNYIVLTQLAVIIFIETIQILIDIKVLPVE